MASAAGVTKGAVSFANTDSQLAVQGYTYVVYAANGSSYTTLTAAMAANGTFDDTDNGASLAVAGYTYTVTGPDGKTYTTLSSAVAANSIFDNTTNTGSTDSAIQSFTVSYKAAYQSAALVVDAAHSYYNANNTASGTSDANPDMFTVSYKAASQSAVVNVAGTSPIKANSKVDSAAGVTSGALSFATSDVVDANSPISAGTTTLSANGSTGSAISFASDASYATLDSQLAKSGYTYTVKYGSDTTAYTTLSSALSADLATSGYTYTVGYGYDVNNTVWYSTLSQALAANSTFDNTDNTGTTDAAAQRFVISYAPMSQAASVANSLYDNTENGSASADSSAQTFRVSYTADAQSAYIRVQQNSPVKAGSSVANITGVTSQAMSFGVTDQYQAANLVVDSASPISANSAVESASGVTSGSLAFSTADSQLAKTGYTYVVYGPKGDSYATLTAALNVTYKYVDQSGKTISADRSTNGYVGSKIPDGSMTISGYTLVGPDKNSDADGLFDADLDSVITYVYKPDSQLAKSGYTYVVNVLNAAGSVINSYTTLTSAVAANKYDNTSNAANATTDAQVQRFKVVYAPMTAKPRYDSTSNSGNSDTSSQAFVVTYKTNQYASLFTDSADNSGNSVLSYSAVNETTNGPASSAISFKTTKYDPNGPISAGSTLTSASGTTGGTISFATNDTSLVKAGYTYTVKYTGTDAPDSTAYTTLSSAVAAQPYTDANLTTAGYSYVVKGPNGSTYATLSSAVAANSIYDATNNSGTTDSSAQVFTVSYVGAYQAAAVAANSFDNTDNKVNGVQSSSDASYQYFTVNYTPATQTTSLVVDSNSPVKAGSVLASSLGATSATLSLYLYTRDYSYANGSYVAGSSAYKDAAGGRTSNAITFATKDSNLPKSGYTYTVTGPDNVTYSTLDSAVIVDASLIRSGYSYYVTDPNGSNYSTMSSAYAAGTNVWDSTSNSAGVQSDGTPQTWTVKYVPDYQGASSATDVTVSQTAANNTITIKYTALPYQESIIQTDTPALWSGSNVITSYWSVDQDNPLGSSATVAQSNNLSGTFATGTTTVKYVDANGNTIQPSTSFVAAVNDTIGITNLSPKAKAGTADIAFAAPTIRGYKVKYQLTWNPTGGPNGGPYISASLKDTNGHSWTINTNNSGITLNPPKAFSVGVNAANGQKANDNFASINGGGGLGIQGFGNALAFGLDFYQNSGDPAAGPFGALRTTNSSGALNSVQDAMYTKGQNLTSWTTTIGQNTIGYYYVNRQFDASQKFTIDGYFHPNLANTDGNLPSNGNWSDWVGLVLTPTDPAKMATDYNMASTVTIDTVTDADTTAGSSRYVEWNAAATNTHTEYAGKGTYNGTAWSAESSSYKDPATQNYAKLTANTISHFRKVKWVFTMGETKTRKKMYKSGKFWVAAGLTALSVGVVSSSPKMLTRLGEEMTKASAAQTTVHQYFSIS
ncbi:KxYKxGKxW signal peptide domain-containing protein [Weissella confusa]|uniref:KxYKxGKxW signal peptide domain-containing protein n=1 Tax=Weissella confusa TaxID=1583 RepID=A0A923ND14_WEICO|nr:KxYKxGKxW signal peptide domain-containing protein [Weissella confusa]